MTLNIILASPTAVYFSADFRICDLRPGREPAPRPDNFDVQKLVPVLRTKWAGLLAYTGTWGVPNLVADVGAWMAEQVDGLPTGSTPRDLLKRLHQVEAWIPARAGRPRAEISFSLAGFEGRRAFVHLVSNCLDHRYHPTAVRDVLTASSFRPKEPCVFNPWGLTDDEKAALLEALAREGANSRPMHRLLAQTNASAAARSRGLISEPCVTGSMIASGGGAIMPHAIPPGPYLPTFITKGLARHGIAGFRPKLDEHGQPLPLRWLQTATKFDANQGLYMQIGEINNVAETIAGPAERGTHAWWRVAGENEPGPLTITVKINRQPRPL